MSDAVQRYVEVYSRSRVVGFFLAFCFGPLGLLYSNWMAAIILGAIVGVSLLSPWQLLPAMATSTDAYRNPDAVCLLFWIIIPLSCWLLGLFISVVGVRVHNERVKAKAELLGGRDGGIGAPRSA